MEETTRIRYCHYQGHRHNIVNKSVHNPLFWKLVEFDCKINLIADGRDLIGACGGRHHAPRIQRRQAILA